MQTYFYQLADFINTLLTKNETTLACLSAEESNFVRFNKNAVRQAGSVKQIGLTLSLIANQRRAESRLTLSGMKESDQALICEALETLRRDLGDLPEDPYLLFNQTPILSIRDKLFIILFIMLCYHFNRTLWVFFDFSVLISLFACCSNCFCHWVVLIG